MIQDINYNILTKEKSNREALIDLINSLEQLEKAKSIIFNRLNNSFSKSLHKFTNLKSRINKINHILGSFSSINKEKILLNDYLNKNLILENLKSESSLKLNKIVLNGKLDLSFASQFNDITNELNKAIEQIINIRKNMDDYKPILSHIKKGFSFENSLNKKNIVNNNQKLINAYNNIYQPYKNIVKENIYPELKIHNHSIVQSSSQIKVIERNLNDIPLPPSILPNKVPIIPNKISSKNNEIKSFGDKYSLDEELSKIRTCLKKTGEIKIKKIKIKINNKNINAKDLLRKALDEDRRFKFHGCRACRKFLGKNYSDDSNESDESDESDNSDDMDDKRKLKANEF